MRVGEGETGGREDKGKGRLGEGETVGRGDGGKWKWGDSSKDKR